MLRFTEAFRDPKAARQLIERIQKEAAPDRKYRFMEFCGGHTHAISRYGIHELLPPQVRMIHGPGCPVCVLPIGRLDMAIELALRPNVILCGYGDLLRVPGSGGHSLLKARAQGAHIEMIYSADEVLAIANAHPEKEVVFFGIGFETTTPPTALLLLEARRLEVSNLSILSNHVLTPPAMRAILDDPDSGPGIHGLVGPAHVSIITGSLPFVPLAEHYRKPIVIAGFEPLDLLQALLMLIRQVNEGRCEVENEYTRAVTPHGNPRALAMIDEAFEVRPAFEWRGLGTIPASGLMIRKTFGSLDAEVRHGLAYRAVADHKACECAAILRGRKEPQDCKVFGTACNPETPLGACMVSSEGACAAAFTYGRNRRTEHSC